MTPARSLKYAAFLRIGLSEAWEQRAEVYGRMLYLQVIVGVFSALWRSVVALGTPLSGSASALVWYLAATEWIVLSVPPIHFQIAEDVRRGDIAYRLPRPISYLGSVFAEALGQLAARLPLLAVSAVCAALLFAGGLPNHRAAFVYVLPFGLAAATLATGFNVLLGLFAFWLDDVMPLHWVWQKLGFVLGGLMLPLDLCPRALQRIAAFTPFPSLMYGPASFLLGANRQRAHSLAIDLASWLVIAGLGTVLVFRRARRALELNGG
jgi:ABC-2 type transport system permease protein